MNDISEKQMQAPKLEEVSKFPEWNKESISEVESAHQGLVETGSVASSMEAVSLEPEVRFDVPNCKVALVTGNPFDPQLSLDYKQGDNPYHASGNCGLMSIMNTLRRGGTDISENQITKYAVNHKLCYYNRWGEAEGNGGTTALQRQKILKSFGINSEIGTPRQGGKLEDIVDAIDSGKGVLISGNAGVLWNCDDGSTMIDGKLQSNHCVAVTGVARNALNGKIVGIYICDSGRGLKSDACRFLSVDAFNDFYTDVRGSSVNITQKPIVEV